MDSADGLREDQADVHRLNFGALQFLDLVRNSVGHHNLKQSRDHKLLGVGERRRKSHSRS